MDGDMRHYTASIPIFGVLYYVQHKVTKENTPISMY